MPPRLELAGKQFGLLVVLAREGKDKHGAWMWRCRCECGAEPLVRGATLIAGKTSACVSCATRRSQTTHGMTATPLYRRWRAMLDRTGNPGNRHYKNYGGRGIRVCARWRSFAKFAEDMAAGFEESLELERVDVNGDYGPENCRWATRTEQQNNRRNNNMVTWRGRTMTAAQWAALLGIKPNTLVCRLRRGWEIERALTTGVSATLLLRLANEDPS